MEPGAALPSVILSLVAVLAVLGLALCTGRWMQRGGRLPRGWAASRGEVQAIRLLAGRALGWQNSLQLLEVDGRRFLIGVGRSGITSLGDWQTQATGARQEVPDRSAEAASRSAAGR